MTSYGWRVWAMIASSAAGGLALLAAAGGALWRAPFPGVRVIVLAILLGAVIFASWVRPLVVYVQEQSEAIHLDEGCLALMLLVVGPHLTVVTFAAASALAQVALRRPVAKSLFNTGQAVLGVGAAGAVYAVLGGAPGALDLTRFAAVTAAAATYLVVNLAAVSAILGATGAGWGSVFADGFRFRMLLDAGGFLVALPPAVMVAADPWTLPVALLPLLIFRIVLAGHFQARHDRARLDGLFRSALAVNRQMGRAEVTARIAAAARELLRGARVELAGARDADEDGLTAAVPVLGETLWLKVSGRSRTEPFDRADQALLDALAAVGAGALTNAELFEEARRQRERLAAITSSLGEGVIAVSAAGEITFMNPAAGAMLDMAPIAADDVRDPAPVPAPEFIRGPALRVMRSAETLSNFDTRFSRSDGAAFDVAYTVSPILEAGSPTGAVLVFHDISERKRLEEQLARHAFHDPLTGLANRRLFLEHFDRALQRLERSGQRHALFFADVDRFKIINDSLGHHAGDVLLMTLAERMQAVLRPGDMLARFGGDEFTMLVEGISGELEAAMLAEQLLEALREPIVLPDSHEVVASMSIGIALTGPHKGRDDLLRDADVAMYQAKAKGRSGHFEVFDAKAMGLRSAERVELETALRSALEEDQLEAYYQPLYSLATREVVGAEALVRWNHPVRGLLGPDQFIGLAEETGLILPLGNQMLRQACRQAREWNEDLGHLLSVSVNLSPRQFQGPGLIEEVEVALSETGADPSQLCFEVTESLAMTNVEHTKQVLARLKALGARVAIDDFGTGYSALGYLASFPVDVVKIDRSFVEGIERDPVKSAIVSAVLTMSRAIGAATLVEGAESEAQVEHLAMLGCSLVQGFYFARPQPARELAKLLRSEVARRAARARPVAEAS